MNRNELEHMLTLVDEKYIMELGDSEETTSEAVEQKPSIRRFVPWAAAAAAVCLCVAGVGLLQHGGIRTGEQVRDTAAANEQMAVNSDTADIEDYHLVWQSAVLDAICCYTLEAGGECENIRFADFPYGSETDAFSADIYYTADGTPKNAFLRYMVSDTKYILVSLCGDRILMPEKCDVDLSLGEDAEKPVIHIFDDGEGYELYYISETTGASVFARGFTAEEATAFTAFLRRNDVTPAYLAQLGQIADAEDTRYTVIHGDTSYVDVIEYKFTAGGESPVYKNPVLPIHNFPYNEAELVVYLNAGGDVSSAHLGLIDDEKRFLCRISDKGRLYPTYFAEDTAAKNISGDSLSGEVVFYVYDASFIDDTDHYPGWEDKTHYQVYCVTSGIGYSIDAFGCTEQEAIDLAWELCGVTASQLYADNKDTEDYSLYFQREASLPVSADFDYYDHAVNMVEETDFDLAFDTAPFTGNTIQFYLDSTGQTVHAFMQLQNESGQSADITISALPGMFVHGQLEEAGSVERDGVRLYGCHPQPENPDYAELCFGIENVDCSITANGLSDEELIMLSDNLIACIREMLAKPSCPFGDLSGEEILLGSPAYVPMLLKPTSETVQMLADALSAASWREMSREGQYPDGECYFVFVYNDGHPFRLTFYSDLTVDMEHDGSVTCYMIEEETAFRAVFDAVHPENAAELLVDCEMENLHNEGVWIGRENGEE